MERTISGANDSLGQRAIVAGASSAGMLAAHALAQSFARVLVLDRDELPSAPASRRATPQARRVHILLKGGEDAIERMLDAGRSAARVQLAAMRDERVREKLTAVNQLLAPFEVLLEPEIRKRVTG
jgi:flavin-dependent dehydrogenase